MSWLGAAIGGGLTLAGMIGGATQDPPGPAQVDDAEEYFEHPVAEAMAQKQFKIAQQLKDISPAMKDAVFQLLPVSDMGPEDRKKFAQAYTEIKAEVGKTALEQVGRAGGQSLQNMVERGVLTQAQADRQKATNQAGINAMAKIYENKLKASEIKMGREDWLRRMSDTSRSANVVAAVSNNAERLMNRAVGAGLGYMGAKKRGISEIELALSRANTSNDISAGNAQFNTLLTSGVGLADLGTDIYTKYKQSRAWDELTKNNPRMDELHKLYQTGMFNR